MKIFDYLTGVADFVNIFLFFCEKTAECPARK